jgi:hypothetical protein
MRRIVMMVCLIASGASLACGGYDCTFSGAEWGFAPNVTYTATWQDPTSPNYFQREVTSDSGGNIRLEGAAPLIVANSVSRAAPWSTTPT